MSEAIGQPSGAALPRPMGVGEILSTAFQLYQRHWRTLLAIAAVVVVPFTLLQYLLGDQVRTRGGDRQRGGDRDRELAVGDCGLVTALDAMFRFERGITGRWRRGGGEEDRWSRDRGVQRMGRCC